MLEKRKEEKIWFCGQEVRARRNRRKKQRMMIKPEVDDDGKRARLLIFPGVRERANAALLSYVPEFSYSELIREKEPSLLNSF